MSRAFSKIPKLNVIRGLIFLLSILTLMSLLVLATTIPKGKSKLIVFIEPRGGQLFPTDGKKWNLRAFPRATFYNAVLGQLFYVDASGNLSPGLVRSWRSNSDNSLWTLHLHEGITFHDGRAATAHDLEFSLVRHMISPHETPEAELLSNILGAKNLRGLNKYSPSLCTGIEVLDRYTIQITLSGPDPYFIQNYALSELSLVPIEHVAEDFLSWKKFPIGAGPYKFESGDNKSAFVVKAASLIKNESGPDVIKFVLNTEEPNIDLVIGHSADLEKLNLHKVTLNLPFSMRSIFFNYSTALAKNDNFRKALALAVDRKNLAKTAGGLAKATSSLIPSNFIFDQPNISESNQKKAKDLLATIPGFTGTITIPLHDEAPPQPWQIELKNQLWTVGITVVYKLVDRPPLSPETNSESYPIEFMGIIPDIGDPTVLYSMFGDAAPYGPPKTGQASSFQVLLKKSMLLQTSEKKKEMLVEIHRSFTDEVRAIPLFEETLTYSITPTTIQNLGDSHQRQSMQFHRIVMRKH